MNSLRTKLFIAMLGVITLTVVMLTILSRREITHEMFSTGDHQLRNILKLSRTFVMNNYNTLVFNQKMALDARKRELEHIVAIQKGYVESVYQEFEAGIITEVEAKKRVVERLRRFRYGKNDYLWISNYQNYLISHPDPTLHQKDASNLKDIYGKLIVASMVTIAKKEGSGYFRYWWRRLGSDQPREKLTYFINFPRWQWVMGSGVYIDDIKQDTEKMYRKIIDELRKSFQQIIVGETGYLFLLDHTGAAIIHPRLKPGERTKKIKRIRESMNRVRRQGEIFYHIDLQTDGVPGHRWGYITYFKPLNWYLGVVIDRHELEIPGRKLQEKIVYLFVVILMIATVIIVLLSRTLTRPINQLSEMMKRVKQNGFEEVSSIPGGGREIQTMGAVFGEMMSHLQHSQEQLRELNVHLEENVAARTKELEEEQEARLRSQEKLAAVGRMTGGIIHDFKGPLGVIQGFIELLQMKGTLNDEVNERNYLNMIKNETTRLTDMTYELLEFARGEVRLQLQEYSILLFFMEMEHFLKSYLSEGITLKTEMNYRDTLIFDHNKMRRVFYNLVINARDALKGHGEIILRSRGDEDGVFFEISDTGGGIPEEIQETLFEPFTGSGKIGHGLGLSIVKEIVEKHGGELFFITGSTGTTFTISLPKNS